MIRHGKHQADCGQSAGCRNVHDHETQSCQQRLYDCDTQDAINHAGNGVTRKHRHDFSSFPPNQA